MSEIVRIPCEFVESQDYPVRDRMLEVLAGMGAEHDPYTNEWLVLVHQMPQLLAPIHQLPEGP